MVSARLLNAGFFFMPFGGVGISNTGNQKVVDIALTPFLREPPLFRSFSDG